MEYLEKRKLRKLNQFQVLQLYMALGGVPYYWSFIQKDHSAAHAIDDLLFVNGAPLGEEYSNLLGSLFNHSDYHESVIQALSRKKKGLNRNELLRAMKMSSGGTATSILREMETSGFIASYIPFGKRSSII